MTGSLLLGLGGCGSKIVKPTLEFSKKRRHTSNSY